MSESIAVRTLDQVTAEINNITEQTRRYVLFQAVEVGKRLCEAKTMMPHGQWGAWLRESVRFSSSTAGNLMRIFEEYGASQMNLFGTEANSQTLGNLSYTKALALLAVPEDEREAFAVEVGAEQLSTRKLEAEVARWKSERDGLAGDVERLEGLCEDIKRDKQKAIDTVSKDHKAIAKEKAKLEKELEANKKTLAELEKKLGGAGSAGQREETEALRRELEQSRADAAGTVARLEKQLAAASSQTVTLFGAHFESARESINKMAGCLLKLEDEGTRGKLTAALRALCNKTLETLGEAIP